MRTLANTLLLLCTSWALGCTSAKPDPDPIPDAAPPPLEACMMLPSVQRGAHFQSQNDVFRLELVDLEPHVPSLGDNRWQLALSSAGEPIPDATLSFSLWMPEHAHGSLKAVLFEPSDEVPGRYTAEPLSFHMPGVWEITLGIETSTEADDLLFETCVVP